MASMRVQAGLGVGIDQVEHDLEVADGELFALTGEVTGWGRSLLRRIAGLDRARTGIFLGETRIDNVPAESRGISMVFQSGALYPHLNVRDNIAFGLRARQIPKAQIQERVLDAAAAMHVEPLLGKAITRLSPAERVRVSLARGLVGRPTLLLLDDPLSDLGGAVRQEVRTDLHRAQRRLKLTMLLCTADVGDALALGTRVAFTANGFVHQSGTPLELYEHPADRFVAAQVGTPPMSLVKLPIENGRVELGWLTLPAPPADEIVLGIRPEDVTLDVVATHSVPLRATVATSQLEGSRALLGLQIGPHQITMLCDPRRAPAEGRDVVVQLDLQRLRLFTADALGVLIPWSHLTAPSQVSEVSPAVSAPAARAAETESTTIQDTAPDEAAQHDAAPDAASPPIAPALTPEEKSVVSDPKPAADTPAPSDDQPQDGAAPPAAA